MKNTDRSYKNLKGDTRSAAVDLDEAVEFLVKDEQERVFLISMVACLFARGVYKQELLAECLQSVGYDTLAETIPAISKGLQARRWQIRLATGYDPAAMEIPGRFGNVSTRKDISMGKRWIDCGGIMRKGSSNWGNGNPVDRVGVLQEKGATSS
jgi:aldehyde:ferredoxin oxidoreductase